MHYGVLMGSLGFGTTNTLLLVWCLEDDVVVRQPL